MKKSEKLLQYKSNTFLLNFTPIWFNWMGWVIILGTLSYLSEKTGSIPVSVLFWISYILLFLYLTKYFYQFDWENFPFIKSPKISFVISVLLSAFLGWFSWYLFSSVVEVLNSVGV